LTPYEVIRAKRDGVSLSHATIRDIILRYASGEVPDYQMAALCMAVFYRGLDEGELAAWTAAMLDSGEVVDLSAVPGVKVDKHSTGGVGDKVSLCLAPMVAACGVPVPMIAGRGLGHTGGTLDKLEAIPGFSVNLSVEEYQRQVGELGVCLMGQTEKVAPADKRLYALRDVTATVDCIPLIASSIMSKKLAEGIDALVLDVKVGSGAFMKRAEDARTLAEAMIAIGTRMGKNVTALVTDMDQPLGRTVGNALEVEEAVAVLRGEGPEDLIELTYALGAQMLVLGNRAVDAQEARATLQGAVRNGKALDKFKAMVSAQGGDPRAVDDFSLLPRAKGTLDILAAQEGYLASIDTEAVGSAAVVLGAGRLRVTDVVDPAVGFTLLKKVGDAVHEGEPLVRVHHNDGPTLEDVAARLKQAYQLGASPVKPRPLVQERLG